MKKILLSLALVASGLFVTGCLKPEVTTEMQAKIDMAQATGKYVDYSAEAVSAVKGKSPYVIFFHAPWCGTCINWEQRIVGSIEELPASTKIFKADYDTYASEFGVGSQSTGLFFDGSGMKVKSVLDPSVSVVADFFNPTKKTAEPVVEIENEIVETESTIKELLENSDENEIVEVVAPIKELSVTVTDEEKTVETAEVAAEKLTTALPAFQYIDYSAEERAKYHGKQTYGVYFHADWCPTCVAYEKKIMARKSEFPAGSVLIKADYDTARTLRQELGVVSQTTFVVLDATGKVIFKKVNPSFEDLVAQF